MKQTYKKTKYVHPNILAFFPSKPAKDISIWDNLRKVAKSYPLEVQKKLEWMIFYETIAKRNASYTSEYFNISRKTFHKWHTKFIKRLMYSSGNNIKTIHTDNGSEFDGFFAKTVRDLEIQRLYSRPYTPKGNGENELFSNCFLYFLLGDIDAKG